MNFTNIILFIYFIPLFSIFCKFCSWCTDFYPFISAGSNRKGIQGGLSVLLVILLFAFIVAVPGVGVAGAAIQFENQIPIYQTRLMEFRDILTRLYSLTRRAVCEFDFTWYCVNCDPSYVEYHSGIFECRDNSWEL
jgi:hypothetical protein